MRRPEEYVGCNSPKERRQRNISKSSKDIYQMSTSATIDSNKHVKERCATDGATAKGIIEMPHAHLKFQPIFHIFMVADDEAEQVALPQKIHHMLCVRPRDRICFENLWFWTSVDAKRA